MTDLFQKMDPECPERYPYLSKAIGWSRKVEKEHKRGHPDLHQRFGFVFWEGWYLYCSTGFRHFFILALSYMIHL